MHSMFHAQLVVVVCEINGRWPALSKGPFFHKCCLAHQCHDWILNWP